MLIRAWLAPLIVTPTVCALNWSNVTKLAPEASILALVPDLAVADTDHNRVLIWNRIPLTNNANADVVLGQANFTSTAIPGQVPTAKSLRGPQGVWIQNGKLFVADTQNNRVLIWNSIPTQNGAAADVVLGQKDFTSFVQLDI